ncbi:MAG: hemerythrin domain-containing protein [Sciscionella sp.]
MSGNPIEKLLDEHANMWRVLSLLRRQLDLIELQDEPDLVLLINALHYMRAFPSAVHHPKEDFIFQKLLDKGTPLKRDILKIKNQHADIYALEDHLIRLALELQAGKHEHLSRLLDLGRQYLKIQAEHAETEERVLFPHALEIFQQDDWKEVRQKSYDLEDPLFGNSVVERYRYLYNFLLREAGVSGKSIAADRPEISRPVESELVVIEARVRYQ